MRPLGHEGWIYRRELTREVYLDFGGRVFRVLGWGLGAEGRPGVDLV